MTLPIHAKQEDSFSVCPQYTLPVKVLQLDIPPLPHLAHIPLFSQTATLVIHTPGIMHTTGFFFCRGSLSLSLSLSPQQTALTPHHSLHQLNTSTEHNEDQNFETVTSLIFLCSSPNLADGGVCAWSSTPALQHRVVLTEGPDLPHSKRRRRSSPAPIPNVHEKIL